MDEIITNYICNTTKVLLQESVPWSVPFDELDGYKKQVVRESVAQQDKELIDTLTRHGYTNAEILQQYDPVLFTDETISLILANALESTWHK